MFLMTAAPLGLGCIIVTDDGETDAASSGPATSSATEADSEQGTDAATEQATDGDTTAGGETDTPATEGNDTTEGAETTEGGAGVCEAYGDQVAECTMNEDYGAEALELCQGELTYYYDLGGEPCLAAYEDYLACLNALDCEQFLGEDPVCEAELAEVTNNCAVE